MKEKISRTSLVVAVVMVLYVVLLGPGIPGSMVLGFGMGAALTVPSIVLGPLKYRIVGSLGLLLVATLAFHDYSAERTLRNRIGQEIRKGHRQLSQDTQTNPAYGTGYTNR